MSDRPTMGFWNGAIIWHTDDLGNFHWGSPADRLARIAWEETRRAEAGAEEREPFATNITSNIKSKSIYR